MPPCVVRLVVWGLCRARQPSLRITVLYGCSLGQVPYGHGVWQKKEDPERVAREPLLPCLDTMPHHSLRVSRSSEVAGVAGVIPVRDGVVVHARVK